MNGFCAFTKKEFTEQLRSYKALILTAVLFLFGMMSPLLAKLLPDILGGMNIEGMTLTIPDPTALDAYAQFFKNVGQLGFIALLLIFSGLLSQDVTRGTLSRPAGQGPVPPGRDRFLKVRDGTRLSGRPDTRSPPPRRTATPYTCSASGALPNLLFSLFCLWLFGVFILALLLCASTLAPGSYGGLLLTAGILVILLVLNSFPAVETFNPAALASKNTALLSGGTAPADLTVTVCVSVGLIALLLAAAVLIFRKKRL